MIHTHYKPVNLLFTHVKNQSIIIHIHITNQSIYHSHTCNKSVNLSSTHVTNQSVYHSYTYMLQTTQLTIHKPVTLLDLHTFYTPVNLLPAHFCHKRVSIIITFTTILVTNLLSYHPHICHKPDNFSGTYISR